jgi:hypothetical protein
MDKAFARKFRKLVTTPSLYFYDYFAKRLHRQAQDSLPSDTQPTFRHEVAWGNNTQALAISVDTSLSIKGAEYFWEENQPNGGRILHLHADSVPFLIAALRANPTPLENSGASLPPAACVSLPSGELVPIEHLKIGHLAATSSIRILCIEQSTSLTTSSIQAVSSIPIVIWTAAFSFGPSSIVAAKQPTKRLCRLRSETFSSHAQTRITVGKGKPPHIKDVTFPIDAVYTWVNDKDPAWLAKKQSYLPSTPSRPAEWRGHHAERFINRDELRYSLRSLEMFAPFVRKVYIVSDNQTPEWLNTAHPKISVVSHEQIFADSSCLPTFNSHAIESQLHHIDGLAEHFIYFNDDVFLGALCSAEDFFEANGAIRFYQSEQRLHLPDVADSREEYLCANRNVAELLLRDRGVEATEIMMHTPHPCLKSCLTDLERRYPAEYARCAANRFRDATDITSITFAQYHFGYLDKLAVPSKITHSYLALWKPHIATQLQNVLHRRACKTFCINDAGVPSGEVEAKTALVCDFLESYFPFKSSFEL